MAIGPLPLALGDEGSTGKTGIIVVTVRLVNPATFKYIAPPSPFNVTGLNSLAFQAVYTALRPEYRYLPNVSLVT